MTLIYLPPWTFFTALFPRKRGGCALPSVLLCGSALPDWTPSTRQMDKRRPAPRCPQAPTVPPHGTTGTTPSEVAMARPADSTTPRARKGTMYVISSILLPHPHPPPTHCSGIYYNLYKWVLSCSFVLVDMNSHWCWKFFHYFIWAQFLLLILFLTCKRHSLLCKTCRSRCFSGSLWLLCHLFFLFVCLFLLFASNREREQS